MDCGKEIYQVRNCNPIIHNQEEKAEFIENRIKHQIRFI